MRLRGPLAEEIKARPGPLARGAEAAMRRLYDQRMRLAALGNAATRVEAFVYSKGMFAYGASPDIDGLFDEHATRLGAKRREATLYRIQQLMRERVLHLPLFESALLNGVGPPVAESGRRLIPNHLYAAPFEDLKLKK